MAELVKEHLPGVMTAFASARGIQYASIVHALSAIPEHPMARTAIDLALARLVESLLPPEEKDVPQ
jgi:hypothetical protein